MLKSKKKKSPNKFTEQNKIQQDFTNDLFLQTNALENGFFVLNKVEVEENKQNEEEKPNDENQQQQHYAKQKIQKKEIGLAELNTFQNQENCSKSKQPNKSSQQDEDKNLIYYGTYEKLAVGGDNVGNSVTLFPSGEIMDKGPGPSTSSCCFDEKVRRRKEINSNEKTTSIRTELEKKTTNIPNDPSLESEFEVKDMPCKSEFGNYYQLKSVSEADANIINNSLLGYRSHNRPPPQQQHIKFSKSISCQTVDEGNHDGFASSLNNQLQQKRKSEKPISPKNSTSKRVLFSSLFRNPKEIANSVKQRLAATNSSTIGFWQNNSLSSECANEKNKIIVESSCCSEDDSSIIISSNELNHAEVKIKPGNRIESITISLNESPATVSEDSYFHQTIKTATQNLNKQSSNKQIPPTTYNIATNESDNDETVEIEYNLDNLKNSCKKNIKQSNKLAPLMLQNSNNNDEEDKVHQEDTKAQNNFTSNNTNLPVKTDGKNYILRHGNRYQSIPPPPPQHEEKICQISSPSHSKALIYDDSEQIFEHETFPLLEDSETSLWSWLDGNENKNTNKKPSYHGLPCNIKTADLKLVANLEQLKSLNKCYSSDISSNNSPSSSSYSFEDLSIAQKHTKNIVIDRNNTKPDISPDKLESVLNYCTCHLKCCCDCSLTDCCLYCSVDCQACFHVPCSQYSCAQPCHVQRPSSQNQPKPSQHDTPYIQWTNTNVLEWMTAVNLYPLAEIFKANNVMGCDLPNLDDEKLTIMGIKNCNHRIAILQSIRELTSGILISEQPHITLPSEAEEVREAVPLHRQHIFIESSFNAPEICDKCNRYLRGVIHQGLQCELCNFIIHRTCLANGLAVNCPAIRSITSTNTISGYYGQLNACDSADMAYIAASKEVVEKGALSNLLNTSYTLQNIPIFGIGLCHQFDSEKLNAPAVLITATNALELKVKHLHIDLYKLYKSTSIPDDYNSDLIDMLTAPRTDLSTLERIEPQQLVGFIKKYLRELKDPIIPMVWYDKFIAAAIGYH
ncbi:probable protein phosphatase DDB_G0282105 isoform X3 [Episyrphus balteatus]|uniref:probable protein phosphatase DDB_G0282105 isoform X3 n=1 Tax=Episyrphus balteatus TaxID=286459 RepID=UPI002484E3CE|nr:probable protein phosphatase DDB_G0282105 isoform X3 [Episyrphus balteatus]